MLATDTKSMLEIFNFVEICNMFVAEFGYVMSGATRGIKLLIIRRGRRRGVMIRRGRRRGVIIRQGSVVILVVRVCYRRGGGCLYLHAESRVRVYLPDVHTLRKLDLCAFEDALDLPDYTVAT